ncbi:MAG TPA: sugar ABC transporter substrate-binding protein [Propionibacteriaceae bacterium]
MTTALRRATAALAATALLATGAACGGGGGGGGGAAPEAQGNAADVDAALQAGGTLTYWSWTPSAEAQVAAFEKAYPKVDIKLVNAGTGQTHYTKLQNAIKAGSGAPDVAQIEYFALPQFALAKSLVDLNAYGFGSFKDQYSPGPWSSVAINNGLFGLPQDSGPMAMFYNKTVFDKHKIAVPKTWDEYIAAAKKLNAADPKAFMVNDTGDAGFTTSMIWQAGGRPFQTNGSEVTVNLQDEGSKKWANTWNPLVQDKLVSTVPGWTDDWFKSIGNGSIATLLAGAWMPGVLESSAKPGAGQWRVAPLPTYDGAPANAENGGGAQSVLAQSKSQALAAGFVKWLNNDKESIKVFLKSGGFPATTADLTSPSFLSYSSKYFGGQKINQVLAPGAEAVSPGWNYLPYQTYANSVFPDTVGQSYAKRVDLNTGLQAWQKSLVDYGTEQGFTVKAP